MKKMICLTLALTTFLTPVNSQELNTDIEIRKVNYQRNDDAIYCKRSIDIADTIVFHHAASTPETTAEDINNFHLQRGTATDPWLMIAYHFTINAPYSLEGEGQQDKNYFVTQGRPLDIVGAHAGTDAYTHELSKETSDLIKKTKIFCGKEGEVFKEKNGLFNNQQQVKANIPSIGVVFIGNYSPFNAQNPSGFPIGKERLPNSKALELAAKLSCKLQKQYPRLNILSFHGFFRPTDCPGTIKKKMDEIRKLTEKLGCQFQILPKS